MIAELNNHERRISFSSFVVLKLSTGYDHLDGIGMSPASRYFLIPDKTYTTTNEVYASVASNVQTVSTCINGERMRLCPMRNHL